MKKAYLHILATASLLTISVCGVFAETAEPVRLQSQLTRVALFKNGIGFFVREGTLPEGTKEAMLTTFSAPSHGTFWVSCPATLGLKGVVGRYVGEQHEIDAIDMADLLRANVGQEVTIWTTVDRIPVLTGEILSFAPDRGTLWPLGPYQMGPSADYGPSFPKARGQFVLIKTDGGITALAPHQVARIDFTAAEISSTISRDVTRAEVEVSFEDPSEAGDWLSISYLAKGISWAPSYLIDISDPEQARLSAKAFVFNDCEFLEGTHVDLVTGLPNLRFADIMSPMAMKQGLAGFLRSLAPGGHRDDRGITTQAITGVPFLGAGIVGGFPSGALRTSPDYGTAAATQVVEDLFLYPLEDITLAPTEVGYYPLFTETVPYTEFYQWEIPDYVTEEDRYGDPRREGPETSEEVWHSLRLTNATNLPWTTAPAEIMKDGQIIGQDIVNYTPAKAEGTVKITQAVGVRAEQTELEAGRDRETLRMYGDVFDRVTIEGTLRVTNYQAKSISLQMTKLLSGELRDSSPKARDTALARGLRRMNPTHLLTWELQLQPGEHQEVTYAYDVLVRR